MRKIFASIVYCWRDEDALIRFTTLHRPVEHSELYDFTMFSEGHCSFFDVAELEDYTEPIQESPLHVGTGPVLFDRSHNHKLICSQQTHGIRINYSSAGHYDLQGDQKKITSEISGTFRSTKHLLHCFSSIKIVTMRQLRHTQNTNLVRSQRLRLAFT